MKVSAPGKQMIAGEWAVLELSNPCIVASINKRVFVEIDDNDEISVSVKDFDIKDITADFDGKNIIWNNATEEQKAKLIFAKGAIETALQYIGDYKPFRINSWGEESQIEVNGVMKKIGFGSSAASVVAIIGAILKFNGYDIESKKSKDVIYKLSTIAHFFAQGKVGSAFDVAASTYGGLTFYKRFDPKWLTEQINSGKSVKEIAESNWPGFHVEKLDIPEDFILLIGWTKESSSTVNLVKSMDTFKNSNPEEYKRIYSEIGALVKKLFNAWKHENKDEIISLIRENEILLRELTYKSGLPIETHELKTLSEIANKCGGAGKLSGAGGGDCGIAVCFDQRTADCIVKQWEKAGLYFVNATIDIDGIKVE